MPERLGVPELIAALVELRERFDLASVAASNVVDDGSLVTVTVYRSLATISDEDGHTAAVPLVLG